MRPADFSVTYQGYSGPLPPPHYSEHAIRIGPGPQGSLEMTAGYPGPGTPVWTERFVLGEEHLDWLHGVLAEQGLFTLEWPPSRDVPVGGGSRKLTVTANGRQYGLPPFVVAERQSAAEIMLGAVRALLPDGMWQAMEARRAAYAQQPVAPPPFVPNGARPTITLYEENQVGIATFLGTPIAGATLMAINSVRLGRPLSGVVTLAFGAIASLVAVYFSLAVNATGSRGSQLFSLVIGIVGALLMRWLAGWLQGDEIAAHANAGGESASGVSAIGIGLLFLVGIFVAIVALGLNAAG